MGGRMEPIEYTGETIRGLFSLRDKTALVTGGAGLIGFNIAKGLSAYGANIVLAGRTGSTLERAAAKLRAGGGNVQIVEADCRLEEDCRRMVAETVRQHGAVDILVSAAAMFRRFPAEGYPEDICSEILATNIMGTFLINKHAGLQMLRQAGGKIINISSAREFVGHSMGYSVFSASKGAVGALTRQLATEWAGLGIHVNCIAPIEMVTAATEKIYNDKEKGRIFTNRIPFERVSVPQELIGTAVFLASDASDFITGQTICVDGGCTTS